MKQKIIIIGAGPAGLTAAHELVDQGDYEIHIFEKTNDIGGISKTANYKGNRIDIGGHRFFSKSDRVMDYWVSLLPLQAKPASDDIILGRQLDLIDSNDGPDPEKDACFLLRNRISRIYFLRSFFDYPISLKFQTLMNLGIVRTFKIGFGYVAARVFPRREEKNLEDFMINRFGIPLYKLFFKSYTKKVWGKSCAEIPAEWGAQRIKGLSIGKAILHALKQMFTPDKSVRQKEVESSLIERFLYPKLGPGELWETDARYVQDHGATISFEHDVEQIHLEGSKIKGVTVKDLKTGEDHFIEADHVISSMPVKHLIERMDGNVPANVFEVASHLEYRDFLTVGVLVDKMLISNDTEIPTVNNIIPDNWIYVQERDVVVGRLQIFNNWSPYLLSDPQKIWIGMEYFCNKGDELWEKTDEAMKAFAVKELASIGIINPENVEDGCVIRMEKAYPAYFGSYNRFNEVREFIDLIPNLYPVGRNGMHRYNNMDHSMLSAMTAAELIRSGSKDKTNLWNVNSEQEYHEKK